MFVLFPSNNIGGDFSFFSPFVALKTEPDDLSSLDLDEFSSLDADDSSSSLSAHVLC